MVRLKLLRDIHTFTSVHEPQFDKDGNEGAPKRHSHKVKGAAGQIRDFPRVDAEKMVVSQGALPVDENGDITLASMKALGKHEKRLLWDGIIKLSDVERDRLREFYTPPKEGTPVLDALMDGKPAPPTEAEIIAQRIKDHAPKDDAEAAERMKKIQESAAAKLSGETGGASGGVDSGAGASGGQESPVAEKPPRKPRRSRAQIEADGDTPRQRKRK